MASYINNCSKNYLFYATSLSLLTTKQMAEMTHNSYTIELPFSCLDDNKFLLIDK